MKIAVSGASGQLGQTVLAELKRRGSQHDIVGVSRTPGSIQAPIKGRLGDYDQPETLLRAYQDIDRLLIIPSADVRPGVRGHQLKAAIDAAVHQGVGQIVLISSAATREVAEPDMYAPYWTAEQHLIKTAPHWSILRMNYYAESFAQIGSMVLHSGVLAGFGENRVAFVSRDDLAAAAAGILMGEGHAGAIYNATGPTAVTGAGRAAILSEVTGKPLRFTVLDEAHIRANLLRADIPHAYINVLIDIEEHFLEGRFDIVTGDVERLAGRKPKSLREILSKVLE